MFQPPLSGGSPVGLPSVPDRAVTADTGEVDQILAAGDLRRHGRHLQFRRGLGAGKVDRGDAFDAQEGNSDKD